jgi:dihydroflavonol-4-reductase
MKVFVTGANGLLGSNVVRQLLTEGHEVTILARSGANMNGLKGTNTTVISGDLQNEDLMIRSTAGFDVLIHAAAKTSQWPTDLKHYEAINVKGTEAVINAVKRNGIPKLIHVSTANTFGYGTREHPGTEETPYRFQQLDSGYITSKYLAQQMIIEEVMANRLPAIIVNPTFMIGPYDAKPSSGRIIQMGLNKKIQVFPSGGKNFIHVRDAAVAVCNAIHLGKTGECYLLANENLTYREFYEKINRVVHQDPVQVQLPGFILNTGGKSGSFIEKVFKRPIQLNSVNARLLVIGNYYSGKKAVEMLKMPQTPIETAILEAIMWWQEKQIV